MMAIANVVLQHAEDAAILWLQRELAVGSPHYSLADLAQLDEQLEAYLDGLRVAENEGWETALAELTRWNGPGEFFVAGILAWESNEPGRIDSVSSAAAGSPEGTRAFIASLGWLSAKQAQPHLDLLLANNRPWERGVGIAACAIRGVDPGTALDCAVHGDDSHWKARALLAIGVLARHDLLNAAQREIESADPLVVSAAAWSVARLSFDEPANRRLQAIIESQSAGHERALDLVVRRVPPEGTANWLNDLAHKPACLRAALRGTGIAGLPDAVPWLLQAMKNPAVARVAGESLSMITGVDLPDEKLDATWPGGFVAGPTEDPRDDNVVLDADENLPWPNVAKIATWWDRRCGDFAPGVRHLCGRPIDESWLEHVLRHGYQRQRVAAALELAFLRPAQPLFNVRAPASLQKQILGLTQGTSPP